MISAMTGKGFHSSTESLPPCVATRGSFVVMDDPDGGRCRIRTCDFHRVKVALYR